MKWHDIESFKMWFLRKQGLTLEKTGDLIGISLKSVNYHMKKLKKYVDKLQLEKFYVDNFHEIGQTDEEKQKIAGDLTVKFFKENRNIIDNLKAGKDIDTKKEEQSQNKNSDLMGVTDTLIYGQKQKNNDSILKKAATEAKKIYWDFKEFDMFEKEIQEQQEKPEKKKTKEDNQEEQDNINLDKILMLGIPLLLFAFLPALKKPVNVNTRKDKENNTQKQREATENKKNIDYLKPFRV